MNEYLETLASQLLVDAKEKFRIKAEIKKLIVKFQSWKEIDQVKTIKLFGSFQRDTILPGNVDPDSDIDMMIIFKDAFRTSKETFYEMLLEFAQNNYPQHILKDEPSIVLKLSEIKIEFTPGVEKGASINLQIPTVNNQYLDWTWTDPFELIKDVDFYDRMYEGKLRPLIRLFKLWNVNTGHHYPSYKLEHYLSHLSYINTIGLWEMFRHAATNLPAFDSSNPETVVVLKACVGMIEDYERKNMHNEAHSVLNVIFDN